MQTQRPQTQPEEEEEVEVEESEELGHVDTFADYRPSKCKRCFIAFYNVVYGYFERLKLFKRKRTTMLPRHFGPGDIVIPYIFRHVPC